MPRLLGVAGVLIRLVITEQHRPGDGLSELKKGTSEAASEGATGKEAVPVACQGRASGVLWGSA